MVYHWILQNEERNGWIEYIEHRENFDLINQTRQPYSSIEMFLQKRNKNRFFFHFVHSISVSLHWLNIANLHRNSAHSLLLYHFRKFAFKFQQLYPWSKKFLQLHYAKLNRILCKVKRIAKIAKEYHLFHWKEKNLFKFIWYLLLSFPYVNWLFSIISSTNFLFFCCFGIHSLLF